MKKYIILLLSVFVVHCSYSQSKKAETKKIYDYTYSTSELNDFAESAFYQYKYGDNRNFYVLINRAFIQKGYSSIDAAIAIEKIKTDAIGREIIFKAFADQFRSTESISQNIYSIGTNATTAKNIALYISHKYSDPSYW